jgi:hypothetical protein
MNSRGLFLLRVDGSGIVDFGKVSVGLVRIDSITHDKNVIDIRTEIVGLDFYLSAGLLVQEGTDLDGTGVRKGQSILEKLECPTAVDDVLDDEDILSFNRGFNILSNFDNAGRFHSGSITGQPDKIDLDGEAEMANQVSEEHKSPFKNADEHQFLLTIVFRDLLREPLYD